MRPISDLYLLSAVLAAGNGLAKGFGTEGVPNL
jgi:hypothetical protein